MTPKQRLHSPTGPTRIHVGNPESEQLITPSGSTSPDRQPIPTPGSYRNRQIPSLDDRLETGQHQLLAFGPELETRLRRLSRLWRLTEQDVRKDKATLFHAYLHDAPLLLSMASDIDRFVRSAIRCGIAANDETALENKSQQLCSDFSSLAWTPPSTLDAYRAGSTNSVRLLGELRQEFSASAGSLLSGTYDLLLELALRRFIGTVTWTAEDTAHYYYFRYGATECVTSLGTSTTHEDYPHRPLGERHVAKTVERRKIDRDHFIERHDHHLFNAVRVPASCYGKLIPVRIAEALDAAPAWLLAQLGIVEGDIMKERIIRWDLGEETEFEEEVIAVEKYSPAILLGDFALAGWNDDDLKGPTRKPRERGPLAGSGSPNPIGDTWTSR
jgi:hypothetical protein